VKSTVLGRRRVTLVVRWLHADGRFHIQQVCRGAEAATVHGDFGFRYELSGRIRSPVGQADARPRCGSFQKCSLEALERRGKSRQCPATWNVPRRSALRTPMNICVPPIRRPALPSLAGARHCVTNLWQQESYQPRALRPLTAGTGNVQNEPRDRQKIQSC
jgi:hypothetical protein